MRYLSLITSLFALAVTATAFAEDPPPAVAPAAAPADAPPAPSAAEITKVANYFLKGKGAGPILVASTPCLKVDSAKDSPTRSDCIEPVSGPVKKNATVSMWTSWLIPEGDKYDDVSVQFLFDGKMKAMKEMALSGGSLRYRTYSGNAMSKPGKWQIKVMRGEKELTSAEITVQ